MIQEITDVKQIYDIWKPFTKELGIPYKDYIQEQVDKHAYFAYYVNGKIAGITTYYIYNRKKQIFIEALIVLPEYRGMRISSKLICYCYKQVESLIKTLGFKFMVNAQEGLPNNEVYKHLSVNEEHFTSRSGKTKLIDYEFNLPLLDKRCEEFEIS